MNCSPSVFAHVAPCSPQMGGIKSVLVADPDDVTLVVTRNAGTAVLAAAVLNTKPFYRWEVAPGQSTLTSEAQINEANNVRYFATDLSVALNGFDPGSAGANLLSRLTRLLFIVECKNGKSYFVGLAGSSDDLVPQGAAAKARGADVTNFSWTPGQATGDAVRATIAAHIDAFLSPLIVSNYSTLVNE